MRSPRASPPKLRAGSSPLRLLAACQSSYNLAPHYQSATTAPAKLKIDHEYSVRSGAPVVVLYADVLAADFPAAHLALMPLAESGTIAYRFRYRPPVAGSAAGRPPLVLAGYGVELAVKSAEYKASDDRSIDETAGDDAGRDDDAAATKQGDTAESAYFAQHLGSAGPASSLRKLTEEESESEFDSSPKDPRS